MFKYILIAFYLMHVELSRHISLWNIKKKEGKINLQFAMHTHFLKKDKKDN